MKFVFEGQEHPALHRVQEELVSFHDEKKQNYPFRVLEEGVFVRSHTPIKIGEHGENSYLEISQGVRFPVSRVEKQGEGYLILFKEKNPIVKEVCCV